MLQKLLGSQARAEIIKILFTSQHKVVHLRELSRLSDLSAPVLLRELRQLVRMGLVISQKDGNRVNYSANKQGPLFGVLCELVSKTDGAIEILRSAFSDISADFVFVFGSLARGTDGVDSDIDLFVIGDCGLREVSMRICSAANEIRQEINPYVITLNDFQSRIKMHDHFLVEVCASQKVFLKGEKDEFERLAG